MWKKNKIFFIIIVLFFSSCHTEKKINIYKDKNNEVSVKQSIQNKALFYDANKQKNLGNYSKAAVLFEQCIEKDPNIVLQCLNWQEFIICKIIFLLPFY